MKADLVIMNGNVITVDSMFSIKEAIAIKDGKILAVGSNEDIEPLRSDKTEVLDLSGKTILPGINDSHMHGPFFGSSQPPVSLDLTPAVVRSIKDLRDALQKKVAEVKPGEWIRGFGWDMGAIEECKNDPNRFPVKDDIDDLSPDNPVAFIDFSGHTMLVNSKALELANVNRDTPDPDSGEMQRSSDSGEPTGIFMELGAQSLISTHIPLMSREEKKKSLLTTMNILNSEGITSYTDAAIGPGGELYSQGVMSSEFIDIYQELLKTGELTTRVTVLLLMGDYGALSLEDLEWHMKSFKLPEDLDTTWLNFPGIKIFADGIPPTQTAWMKNGYVGGGNGSLVIPGKSDDEKVRSLHDMIQYIDQNAFQVAVHATGDAAIEASIDGIIAAVKKSDSQDLRHYIIHSDFINDEYTQLAADYKMGISMQPYIKSTISDFTPAIVGKELAAMEFPMRRVLDAGIPLTSSSDAPVTFPNWRLGIQAAVLRESVNSGTVSGPDQCITVEEAIRTYTINGAWQDHMDHVKGSIEVGKVADFCVIDQDILNINPHQIGNINVDMTIVNGKVVYFI
jgi:predicted amidohydrolase YtcJ